MSDTTRFLWKLSLRLEGVTYLQGVPIGVIFIILATGFAGEKLIAFFEALIGAVIVSFLLPLTRWFFVKSLLSRSARDSEDPQTFLRKKKALLLNFPRWEMKGAFIQWTFGVAFTFCVTHFLVGLEFREGLPFLVFWFMIVGITLCSHFYVSEIVMGDLLKKAEFRAVELSEKEYRPVTLAKRFILTISAIVTLPVLFLVYFLVMLVEGERGVYPLEYGLAIAFIFLALMIYTTSNLFLNSLKQNSTELSSIARSLAGGNIQDSMPMISTDEIGQISLGMNSFLTKLKSVMETIRQEARNLRGHSEKLASETSGFHSLIQDQSAAYEEMSASVEELASSASSVTSQAEKQEEQCRAAGKAVGELSGAIGSVHVESATARSEAERMASEVGAGRESIQLSVRTMDRIKSSTDNISTVLGMILGIAEKIGMLSLNASIEAARAGESGRGFSVVANEISLLGESTNKSAVQIRKLIEEAAGSVMEGIGAMAQSSLSFERIEESVRRSAALAERIAQLSDGQLAASETVKKNFDTIANLAADIKESTAEQSRTLQEFVSSVVRLSQNTQTAAANSENIEMLAAKLADQSVVLNKEVDFFHA